MCICGRISGLAKRFSEREAKPFISELNNHLALIESIVNKSKSVARHVHYDIRANPKRPMKILSIKTVGTSPQTWIFERFQGDPEAFW